MASSEVCPTVLTPAHGVYTHPVMVGRDLNLSTLNMPPEVGPNVICLSLFMLTIYTYVHIDFAHQAHNVLFFFRSVDFIMDVS